MITKVGIIQSSYIPWKGYFDLINDVDIFVFLDNVEFSKGSWRNRNRIKTAHGVKWLTVPLQREGLNHRMINEVLISETPWWESHLHQIELSYSTAPYFRKYYNLIEAFYSKKNWSHLSQMNQEIIKSISTLLGIKTQFIDATSLTILPEKSERLVRICQDLEADVYISGPSAQNYLDVDQFNNVGIEVRWKEYDYPEYSQLFPPFVHEVSIFDLLFMQGDSAPNYIWGDKLLKNC